MKIIKIKRLAGYLCARNENFCRHISSAYLQRFFNRDDAAFSLLLWQN